MERAKQQPHSLNHSPGSSPSSPGRMQEMDNPGACDVIEDIGEKSDNFSKRFLSYIKNNRFTSVRVKSVVRKPKNILACECSVKTKAITGPLKIFGPNFKYLWPMDQRPRSKLTVNFSRYM